MSNYRCEFSSLGKGLTSSGGSFKCKKYKIDIITDTGDTTYNPLTLAGGSSCVLEYNTSETPFEPIRTSTLSMTFVHDNYLEDLLKPHAQDVIVKLWGTYTNSGSYPTTPEWVGYLQQAGPQNNSYANCLEDITLTANDLLLTADFKKYVNISGTGKKQVVNLEQIFRKMFTEIPLLKHVRWPKTKMSEDGEILIPKYINISENNFYSSDTDNGWTYKHFVESVAKYFGWTALMWEETLCFIDYLDFARVNSDTFNNKRATYGRIDSNNNYWSVDDELHVMKNITAGSYRGSGNQISFYPVYNKVKVTDSYYQVDKLIPNIFDDDNVLPEYGNLKECRFVAPRMEPHRFVNSDGYIQDDEGENYYYYKRELKSKMYDSHWYKAGDVEMSPEEIKAIPGFQVLNDGKVEETVMGTNIWVNGWGGAFYDKTKEGCALNFSFNGTRDYIVVRWNGGTKQTTLSYLPGDKWTRDIQGNYVPTYSIFVNGSSYDIVNTSFDYDYQWHHYDDGTVEFYYGFNGYEVYIVPIWHPVDSISPWNYWGYCHCDEYGFVDDYAYFDDYPPLCMYGYAGLYYGDTEAVTSAKIMLYLDNSTNDEPREYKPTWTYGVGTGFEVSTTQSVTLPPHGFTQIEMFTWVNGGQYDGPKVNRISLDGVVQEWTSNSSENPSYSNGANLIRLYKGAKLIEYANFRKEEYQNELPSSISFERYLAISQQGGTSGTSATTLIERYLPVFTLKESTAPAVLVDTKNTAIVIDADAIYERYRGTDYINPDWKSEPRNKGDIEPALILTLGIGNKYWNGKAWNTGKTAFEIPMQWKATQYVDQDNVKRSQENVWNSSLHIKNQVSWNDWTGAAGYVIPLNGVDLNGEITFEIRMPKEAQRNVEGNFVDTSINGMCYISKLDMYLGTDGGELDDLSDVVYENVIDEQSINEISAIDLDITTYPGKGKMSYSHIGHRGKLMQNARDITVYGDTQPEEANIIERYVHQFCTKTCVKDLDLDLNQVKPFWAYIDTYDDNNELKPYIVLGQRRDLYMGVDTVHLMEIKKYYEWPETNKIKVRWTDDNYEDYIGLYDGDNNQIDKIVTPLSGGGYDVEYIFYKPINNLRLSYLSGHTNVTDIWLPDCVTRVDQTITYGSERSVDPRSFSGCTNLNHIVCPASTAPLLFTGSGISFAVASSGYLEVPIKADYTSWYNLLPDDWSGIVFTSTPQISVGYASTASSIDFNYIGSSAGNLRASSDGAWCTVNLVNNGNNSYTIVASVSENKVIDQRTCKIVVSDGVKTRYVDVSQAGADLTLYSVPSVSSGTAIVFKPDGTPKAISSQAVNIEIVTNGPLIVHLLTQSWVNMQWADSNWTMGNDGLYRRNLLVNCSENNNIVPRSNYVYVNATKGADTKEIKMYIRQEGEAKVNWSVYQWIDNKWYNTTWADRAITQCRISSDAEAFVVVPRLIYNDTPDFSSGDTLYLTVTNTTSNWGSVLYGNPFQCQLVPDYESGGTNVGHIFLPAFYKTMPAEYQEPFIQPSYGGTGYCSFPATNDKGEAWNIFAGTTSRDRLTFTLSSTLGINLTNNVITVQIGR